MLRDVYFVESDLGEPMPGEVLVAVPAAVSRCTVRFASEAFPGLDPFRRGMLGFLLAGVSERAQLSKLLGITDLAYLDLMIDDLEDRDWAHRSGNAVRYTDAAVRALHDHVTTAADRIGHLFYWADDAGAPLFFAGPLRLEGEGGRVQRLDDPEAPSALIEVGTSGRNRAANCLLPAPPAEDPHQLPRSIATDKSEYFLRRAARSSARTIEVPEAMRFSVTPSPPESGRLLVRIVPGKGRHQTFVTPVVSSPDLDQWIRRLGDLDAAFRDELRARLDAGRQDSRSGRREPARTRPDSTSSRGATIPSAPESKTASVPTARGRVPTWSERQHRPRKALIDLLRRRLAKVATDRHVGLVRDRQWLSATIGRRLLHVGFRWDDVTPMPMASEWAMAAARELDWNAAEDLWALFAAWALLEDEGCIREVAVHLPDLASTVIAIHRDGHQTDQEAHDVVTDLQSILEEH